MTFVVAQMVLNRNDTPKEWQILAKVNTQWRILSHVVYGVAETRVPPSHLLFKAKTFHAILVRVTFARQVNKSKARSFPLLNISNLIWQDSCLYAGSPFVTSPFIVEESTSERTTTNRTNVVQKLPQYGDDQVSNPLNGWASRSRSCWRVVGLCEYRMTLFVTGCMSVAELAVDSWRAWEGVCRSVGGKDCHSSHQPDTIKERPPTMAICIQSCDSKGWCLLCTVVQENYHLPGNSAWISDIFSLAENNEASGGVTKELNI